MQGVSAMMCQGREDFMDELPNATGKLFSLFCKASRIPFRLPVSNVEALVSGLWEPHDVK